jgi:hypothetical protein
VKAAAVLLFFGIAVLALAGCVTAPPENKPQSDNIWEEKPGQDVLWWPENSDDKERRRQRW